MPDEKTDATNAGLTYQRVDNFFSTYANNAFFESSAWDMKIIFGQLDQSSEPTTVKQNVAVTIPWAQAKLALYWIRLHVEATELAAGKIPIRKDLLPLAPPPLTEKEREKDPNAQKLHELILKIREEFLASTD